MPLTYESEPMVNYAPQQRCIMLTVGKTITPFYIDNDNKFHERPENMLANAGYDGDILDS
eukprot:scaffold3396_cov49-Cyclotella_meneghiniana.AAC.1